MAQNGSVLHWFYTGRNDDMKSAITGKLNGVDYVSAPMAFSDSDYPVPCDWLKANGRRFHFTDEQILAASTESFADTRWSLHPPICGIYFLIERSTITYVGISNHVPRRIFQHRDSGVPFEKITWMEAPEFFLKDIESYYIARIKPMRNTDRGKRFLFQEIGRALDAASKDKAAA